MGADWKARALARAAVTTFRTPRRAAPVQKRIEAIAARMPVECPYCQAWHAGACPGTRAPWRPCPSIEAVYTAAGGEQ